MSTFAADPASSPLYDEIGLGYARSRRADPRLAAPIFAALKGVSTVLDVGAGAGSYEPRDKRVVAVDPSGVMLYQRRPTAAPAVRAMAEALPFPSGSFDAVMAILTAHHWSDRSAGFSELRRVARLRVVLTFDPAVHNRMWLMDYVPEMASLESARAPSIDEVYTGIEGRFVAILPVPHDCRDAMTIANWRHPEAYLDPAVRAGGSALRQVDSAALRRGLDQLAEDLRTGRWLNRYGDLLGRQELDCGLRLVVGGSSSPRR